MKVGNYFDTSCVINYSFFLVHPVKLISNSSTLSIFFNSCVILRENWTILDPLFFVNGDFKVPHEENAEKKRIKIQSASLSRGMMSNFQTWGTVKWPRLKKRRGNPFLIETLHEESRRISVIGLFQVHALNGALGKREKGKRERKKKKKREALSK